MRTTLYWFVNTRNYKKKLRYLHVLEFSWISHFITTNQVHLNYWLLMDLSFKINRKTHLRFLLWTIFTFWFYLLLKHELIHWSEFFPWTSMISMNFIANNSFHQIFRPKQKTKSMNICLLFNETLPIKSLILLIGKNLTF